jgi:hypothetical protein
MTEVAIGLGSAALGFVSGLLVPWIKWQVEKRKEQLAYRKDAIKSWRLAIESLEFEVADARSNFMSTAAYSSLRAHMSPDAIKKMESPRTVYVAGGRGGHVRNQLLLDEVTRLEKEWQLV